MDPGYYTSPADIIVTTQALLKMIRFTEAPVFKANLGKPLGGIAKLIDSGMDAALVEDYIRSNSVTIHHVSGSAAMSPRGASWGAVDPDLRVKGVKGLGVVDASVFVSFLSISPSRR